MGTIDECIFGCHPLRDVDSGAKDPITRCRQDNDFDVVIGVHVSPQLEELSLYLVVKRVRTSGRLSVTVIDPIFCGLHHDRLVGHLSSPPFLPEGHGLWKLLVDREFHARVDTLRHLPLDIQSITAIAGIPRAATAFASMGSDDPHRRPLLDYSLFDGDWVDGGARRIYKRYW